MKLRILEIIELVCLEQRKKTKAVLLSDDVRQKPPNNNLTWRSSLIYVVDVCHTKGLNLSIHGPAVSITYGCCCKTACYFGYKLPPWKRRLESDNHMNFLMLGGSASEERSWEWRNSFAVIDIKFGFVILFLSQNKEDLTDISKIRWCYVNSITRVLESLIFLNKLILIW